MQVAMPESVTVYSSSPTRIGETVSGAPRRRRQATWLSVTLPVPSGLTASRIGSLKPVER